MKKKILFIALGAIVMTAFTQDKSLIFKGPQKVRYNLPSANVITTVSKSFKPFEIHYTPKADKLYVGFKEALAFKESRGNYRKVNSLGYLGKYQFGETTLNRIRIYDTHSFLNDPNLKNATEMSIASNLAGKAISISKTTAPHAASYPFTSLFNISHGHAVGLFFENFFKFN